MLTKWRFESWVYYLCSLVTSRRPTASWEVYLCQGKDRSLGRLMKALTLVWEKSHLYKPCQDSRHHKRSFTKLFKKNFFKAIFKLRSATVGKREPWSIHDAAVLEQHTASVFLRTQALWTGDTPTMMKVWLGRGPSKVQVPSTQCH